jgi:hypothetical protein
VIQVATHAIKDRPGQWGPNLTPPPVFDIAKYQKQLDKIGGFTQQGEPVLRLVWGGNESKYKAIGFDTFGNPTEFGMVPRYSFESKRLETWGMLIPIRRWFIEENTDAGQLEAMGGKNHGAIKVKEKGFYTPYILIADHTKCKDCLAHEFKCFGEYKAPDNAELLFLTEVTYKLLKSRKQDPTKGINPAIAAELLAQQTPDESEINALEEQENRAYVKDFLASHLPIRSLPSNPRSLNHANSNSESTN